MIMLRYLMNAVHVLFAALLLMTLAVGVARAACSGEDLRATLDVDTIAHVREQAAATPNGDARLWRVTAPNGAVSHLYGTMHVGDAATVALGPEAKAAHQAASAVVIETVDILDPAKAGAAMGSNPSLLMFTDGRSMLDLLDDEEEEAVDAALRERGMTLDAMKVFKPWTIMGPLAVPTCLDTRPEALLDVRLAKDAMVRGAEAAGLESMVEQIEALSALPMDVLARALVDVARSADDMDDVFATMGALYREGRIAEIWPTLIAVSEGMEGGASAEDQAAFNIAFEQRIVTERNHRMAERAVAFLDKGGAFIAVGALHLPGKEGVVQLLREAGYDVDRIAS